MRWGGVSAPAPATAEDNWYIYLWLGAGRVYLSRCTGGGEGTGFGEFPRPFIDEKELGLFGVSYLALVNGWLMGWGFSRYR